eukprot:4013695-Pyramimonas_sp.AAC.1
MPASSISQAWVRSSSALAPSRQTKKRFQSMGDLAHPGAATLGNPLGCLSSLFLSWSLSLG